MSSSSSNPAQKIWQKLAGSESKQKNSTFSNDDSKPLVNKADTSESLSKEEQEKKRLEGLTLLQRQYATMPTVPGRQ
ncbi:uncharacterized protein N7459_002335 [Penicillium hispanicum]|uniref:uncharacterized protein n=1 Tax=Penicillium hispanicum TaxID=1080232 RepID=UPI002540C694|nr:uncharacterized protein N7459_002335 [Penicillium hispanicum]KAJ5591966.1 hypothetical protein N7459_002335 [Penicillium hispanicum]